MDELTNEELAARIRGVEKGSREYNLLFEKLWLRCDPVLEKVLRGRIGRYPWYWSDEDVKDFKQVAAEKVLARLHKYEGRGPFAAWVVRIVGNEVTDEIRRITGLKHLFSLDWAPDMDEALDRREVPDKLRAEFRDRRRSILRDPEVLKQGQGWIIFADKARRSASTTRGRYKVWKNYDKLDVYHWGDPKELRDSQREPAED